MQPPRARRVPSAKVEPKRTSKLNFHNYAIKLSAERRISLSFLFHGKLRWNVYIFRDYSVSLSFWAFLGLFLYILDYSAFPYFSETSTSFARWHSLDRPNAIVCRRVRRPHQVNRPRYSITSRLKQALALFRLRGNGFIRLLATRSAKKAGSTRGKQRTGNYN